MIGPITAWFEADLVPLLPRTFQKGKLPFLFCCMLLLIVVSLTFSLFNPYPYGSIFQIVFASLILLLLWLIHRGMAMNNALNVMCLLSVLYLLNAARLSGGVYSPRMLWLMLIPVLSYYIMGARHGYMWLVVTWLATSLMGVLTLYGVGVEMPGGGTQQNLYALATVSINCLTLLMVPLVYDRQHRRSLAESQRRLAELEQTQIDLEHTQTMREHFIAAVSHELRTPMNAILGFNTMLMARATDKPRAKQLLEHTRQSADHLMTVINDVLDYSQFLSGRLKAQSEVYNLHETIRHAFDLFAPKVQSMAIAYELDVATEVPVWVVGDRHRLMQILVNLLGNALKFTAQGHVRLRVEQHLEGVMFAVHDTGIGIALEDQAHLFSRFSQAHGEIQRRYGGNGLGLAITQGLVKLLEGRMGFESTLGHGSRFWFVLPLPSRAQPQNTENAATPLAHKDQAWRFLVVDDHRLNRLLVAQVVKHTWPHSSVVEAADGEQALQALREQAFDLVFMDLVMPVLDGAQTTQALRQMPAPQCRTPVMGLTADVSPVDLMKFRASGVDCVLLKPFEPQQLVREAQALLLASPVPKTP